MNRKSTIMSGRFYPEPEKAMKFNFWHQSDGCSNWGRKRYQYLRIMYIFMGGCNPTRQQIFQPTNCAISYIQWGEDTWKKSTNGKGGKLEQKFWCSFRNHLRITKLISVFVEACKINVFTSVFKKAALMLKSQTNTENTDFYFKVLPKYYSSCETSL